MRQGLRLGSVVSLATVALLVAPSSAGASARPAPAAVTPAHLWQAEGNADDSIGTDNGRLVGAAFGPGVLGPDQGFSFAGGGQKVVFDRYGGNRGRGDFTLAFAIKTTATRMEAVWEKRIACNSDGTPFWGFRMKAGKILFELFTGTADYGATSTTSINDGKWHQVVTTRHGVTVWLYIDGNLEATTTTAATVFVANDARMRAGASKCDGIDGTHPFTGELDDLMIFRTAFTQQQVQAFAS